MAFSGDSTSLWALGAALLAIIVAFVLFLPSDLVQWLRKKNYQYEVTFALYMLTPTEKFIFNSVLFLTTSMLATACALYLPNHVAYLSRRVYYYFAGDTELTSRAVASQLGGTASKASDAVLGAASELAGAAYEATMHTASVAQEAANRAVEGLGWG